MLKLNRSDQAKQCFLEALALDVKCYDSFEQLINGEMMSADEGDYLLPKLFLRLYDCRVGFYTGPLVQRPDSRRRGLHPFDIHITAAQVQTHGRTSLDAEAAGGRLWPFRQP
jgi:hypothetical protein